MENESMLFYDAVMDGDWHEAKRLFEVIRDWKEE